LVWDIDQSLLEALIVILQKILQLFFLRKKTKEKCDTYSEVFIF
jgi:hypothetical protein